jgi:hypothetical protein
MIKASFDISFRSYAADMESHTHPFFQIVLASQGALELEIEGHSGRVDSGYVGVIGPGESHAFSARAGNRFLVIDADLQQRLSNVSSLLNKFSNERFVALTPGALLSRFGSSSCYRVFAMTFPRNPTDRLRRSREPRYLLIGSIVNRYGFEMSLAQPGLDRVGCT